MTVHCIYWSYRSYTKTTTTLPFLKPEIKRLLYKRIAINIVIVFQGIVYAVGLLNFPEVEGLWQSFWQGVGLTSQAYKNKLCKEYRKREDTSGDEQDEM